MKKTIAVATIALAVGAVLSPVVGMAIGETRSVILGLAPEEAVLQLADKIDTSKVDEEAKIKDLQTTIDAQKSQILSQQELINGQNTKIDIAKAEVKTVTETVARQKDCSADLAKYCYTSSFKDPDEFKNFLKTYEKMDNYADYKAKFTKEFDACQKALACK